MMFCVGSMCGYLISGFLSDRYGRRPTIAFLSGLAAFSNVFPLVIRSDIAIMSARFLAGISADTVCSIVFLLGKYFVVLNVSVLYVATDILKSRTASPSALLRDYYHRWI